MVGVVDILSGCEDVKALSPDEMIHFRCLMLSHALGYEGGMSTKAFRLHWLPNHGIDLPGDIKFYDFCRRLLPLLALRIIEVSK